MHCLPHTVGLHFNAKLQLGHYVVKEDSLAEIRVPQQQAVVLQETPTRMSL